MGGFASDAGPGPGGRRRGPDPSSGSRALVPQWLFLVIDSICPTCSQRAPSLTSAVYKTCFTGINRKSVSTYEHKITLTSSPA
eukprot:7376831-Pyramimonas_sp.AAC.1